MGIAEDIYTRCRRSLRDGTATLAAVKNGTYPDPTSVTARRIAADMADEAALVLLARAFITPIEREDLWQLRRGAEAVHIAAEDVALGVYHGGVLPASCAVLLDNAATCCEAVAAWFESFPRLPTTAPLRLIRDSQQQLHTLRHERFGDMTVRRLTDRLTEFTDTLIRFVDVCRYTFLKNG